MRVVLVISLLLLFFSLNTTADPVDENDSAWTQATNIEVLKPKHDSAKNVDTTYYVPRETISTAEEVSNPINYEDYLTQQPTVALFKSMLVPGWGQLGNRKYIKAAVVIGLEGWLISNAVHFGRLATKERNYFETETDPLLKDVYYARYEAQKDVRNKYRWFAAITIFASMFDAYVDAHLSGGPDQLKNRNLDLDIQPKAEGGFSASLSFSF